MIAIYLLFVGMLITMGLWAYHLIQYYRKRNDRLISVGVVDKHDAKSQAFLMASFGFLIPLLIMLFILLV